MCKFEELCPHDIKAMMNVNTLEDSPWRATQNSNVCMLIPVQSKYLGVENIFLAVISFHKNAEIKLLSLPVAGYSKSPSTTMKEYTYCQV